MATRLRYEVWYLLALLFLGSIVLWAFVFAWHTQYSHRPVFTLKIPARWLAVTTITGITTAVLLHFLLDPTWRLRSPDDYPQTVGQWLAMALFSLAFVQLFLVFAPFAWLLRLVRRIEPTILLTVLFGVFVLVIKNQRAPAPVSSVMLIGLLIFRVVGGLLSVYFYLQGGVLLVWWWTLLVQSRHLVRLAVEN